MAHIDDGKNHPNEQTHAPQPENKREDFRRYLERSGVLDALTRVLIGLYEEVEKPVNPMEYFLDQLAGGVPSKQQLDQLQEEYARIEVRATELEEDNERLRKRLEQFESTTTTNDIISPVDAGEELGETEPGQTEVPPPVVNP